MSVTIVKKDVLQKETIRLLDKNLVIQPWANTKWEGEIKKQGDTVTVQTVPNVTFATGGTAGADITEQNLTITGENLVVDQVAQLNIAMTDIEKMQSNLDLEDKIAERIAYAQADLYDSYIIGKHTDALAGNEITGVTLTTANVYEKIEDMRTKLEGQNVSFGEGKVALFVLPEVASLIRQSSNFDGYREGEMRRNKNAVGLFAGFEVYTSNNVPAGFMVALNRESIAFASQITNFDIREATEGFRSHIIAELVYGAKVFTECAKSICTTAYTI